MELSSDLLGKLYATAESQQRWRPVLDDLRVGLGAGSAVVQMLDETPERLETVWQARDSRSTTNSDLHDRGLNNPGNPRLHKQRIADLPRTMGTELMLLGSDLRLFARHPRVLTEIQERLAQVGLGHAFWVSFPICEGRRFSLIMHREAGDERDLTEAEEAVLQGLLPHMRQAAQLWLAREQAACRTNSMANALDRLDLALVVCDAELRIEWSNTAAEALIARGQGLRAVGGRLKANSAASNASLRRVVDMVVSGATDSQVCIVGADEDEPIHVRATDSPGTPFRLKSDRVALFLSQPSLRSCLDPADLCALFQLTPAEARLAAALVGGASLASYSEQRGIAVGTARNQLKQVLSKTYTRGQSELVRTLCSSAASRAR